MPLLFVGTRIGNCNLCVFIVLWFNSYQVIPCVYFLHVNVWWFCQCTKNGLTAYEVSSPRANQNGLLWKTIISQLIFEARDSSLEPTVVAVEIYNIAVLAFYTTPKVYCCLFKLWLLKLADWLFQKKNTGLAHSKITA